MENQIQHAIFRNFQNVPGGWSFILDNIEVAHELLPFDIGPGVCLKKASIDQIGRIKDKLHSLLGENVPAINQFYEWTVTAQLPKDEWRYYIVETEDNGNKITDLQFAAHASIMPIDITSINFMNNGGVGWRGGSLYYHFFGKFGDEAPRIIGSAELNDLRESYKEYVHVTGGITGVSEFPEILRALELLDNLNLIPRSSPFHVIGLFAILEMLITHNPKLEDRGDSITHQMKSKIPLLSRRFKDKISSEEFFGNNPEEKIWSKLYTYRSIIAHGGVADFRSSELALLRNSETARMFLLNVVRKMIRHTFSEPNLYKDLRGC